MGIEGYYEDYFDERQEEEKLTNFQKIKQSNINDFAEWLCFGIQTGVMPISYPYKPQNFIREDETYKLGLKIIKDWLQKESEVE